MARLGRGEKDGRLEPEGEAEVPEIIIVSDAVEGPNEEGEEIKSPKRKVIRVESEETQDYLREVKSTEYEDEEERTFVPSASAEAFVSL